MYARLLYRFGSLWHTLLCALNTVRINISGGYNLQQPWRTQKPLRTSTINRIIGQGRWVPGKRKLKRRYTCAVVQSTVKTGGDNWEKCMRWKFRDKSCLHDLNCLLAKHNRKYLQNIAFASADYFGWSNNNYHSRISHNSSWAIDDHCSRPKDDKSLLTIDVTSAVQSAVNGCW